MMMLDSFSGPAADLKSSQRSSRNLLLALQKHPRVSTWDMESAWLRTLIADLLKRGLIVSKPSEYPWIKYSLTESGENFLKSGEQG